MKYLIILLILISITSCSTEIPNTIPSTSANIITKTKTVTSQIDAPIQPIESTPTIQPLLTNTYTPIAEYPALNASGPYLLSNRILLNPDGSGIKMIDYPEEYALGEYSPDGEWRILYIGGLVGDIYTGACVNCEPWKDMSLWLMHIPDGKIIKIADITTYPIMYEKHNWGECSLPISLLIHAKWSPDGRFLAFIADPIGASLDLFTYDTDDHILRRLTNPGIADVLGIIWTPDGKKIFYINGVELQREQISNVGSYRLFTINSQNPEEKPDQGITTYYTGKEKPEILWMNNEKDLIYMTKRYYQCISGSTEVSISHLDLATGKKNTIWPETFISVLAIDPNNRVILVSVSTDISDDNIISYIVDFSGKVIVITGQPLTSCIYFGDTKYLFLCISKEEKSIMGISLEGKQETVITQPSKLLDLEISPKRNWIIIKHSSGIYLYSHDGNLVQDWRHDGEVTVFLWNLDESGLYFILDETQLYYWPISASNPSLIYNCPSSMICFGKILMWAEK